MFLHYLGKTEQAKLKIGKVNPEIWNSLPMEGVKIKLWKLNDFWPLNPKSQKRRDCEIWLRIDSSIEG